MSEQRIGKRKSVGKRKTTLKDPAESVKGSSARLKTRKRPGPRAIQRIKHGVSQKIRAITEVRVYGAGGRKKRWTIITGREAKLGVRLEKDEYSLRAKI